MKKSVSMMVAFRDRIERVIELGLAKGKGESWEDIGVVVVDTTTDQGQKIAALFGEAVEWSDDGKVVTFTTSQERIAEALRTVTEDEDLVDMHTPGALVVCMVDTDDVAVARVPRHKSRSRFLFDALGEQIDTLIEGAIAEKATAWGDVGIVVADLRFDFGRELVKAWAGQTFPEQHNFAILVVTKKEVVAFLRHTKTLPRLRGKLKDHGDDALVLCVVDRDDSIVTTRHRPQAVNRTPMLNEELAEAIRMAVATGKAKSWDDVGVYVVDYNTTAGRELVTLMRPDYVHEGQHPVVLMTKKSTIMATLEYVGREVKAQAGALVVFVTGDGRFAFVHYEQPDDVTH